MQKHYRSNNLCIYGGFKRVLQKSNYHKEHLSLILVWQQEESENGGVGDLVVKGLTVKVKESWVDTDVVSKGEKKNRKLRYSAKRANQNTLPLDYELNGYFFFFICATTLMKTWDCFLTYRPLGVRHCSSLKIHTASPVAWMTSALDSTF